MADPRLYRERGGSLNESIVNRPSDSGSFAGDQVDWYARFENAIEFGQVLG